MIRFGELLVVTHGAEGGVWVDIPAWGPTPPSTVTHTHPIGDRVIPSPGDLVYNQRRPQLEHIVVTPGTGRVRYKVADAGLFNMDTYKSIRDEAISAMADGTLTTEQEWQEWIAGKSEELAACGVELEFTPWSELSATDIQGDASDNETSESDLDILIASDGGAAVAGTYVAPDGSLVSLATMLPGAPGEADGLSCLLPPTTPKPFGQSRRCWVVTSQSMEPPPAMTP